MRLKRLAHQSGVQRGYHQQKTLLTYWWRALYTPQIRRTPLMQTIIQHLKAHQELDLRLGKDVGDDPSRIFYLHEVNKHSQERIHDMLDGGISVVKQGSGYQGRVDGLYTYILISPGARNTPYDSFRSIETFNGILRVLTESTVSKTTIVFRSPDEVPEIKPQSGINVGVFVRPIAEDYENPIKLEVAFSRAEGSNNLKVHSKEAAKAYIQQLLEGVLAIERGLLFWIQELDLKDVETHQDFVNALIEKLKESEDSLPTTEKANDEDTSKKTQSPVERIENELNGTLKNLYTALSVASETALLIGENDLSEELLTVREALGVEPPAKGSEVKPEMYHSKHAHHHHHKQTHKHH